MRIKELKDLIDEVEMRKDIMAKERDAIRDNYHAMGQLLESLDSGGLSCWTLHCQTYVTV